MKTLKDILYHSMIEHENIILRGRMTKFIDKVFFMQGLHQTLDFCACVTYFDDQLGEI